MGKADEILRSMGSSIAESASHRGAPAAMPTAPHGLSLNPERLAGVTRSKAALDIPLGKIEPDPDQPREEFDDEALARLSESIRTRGVLQPIRVRWADDRACYVIIAGERRWRAARMAGLLTLPCVVDDRPATAGELLTLQLIENIIREDLKPVEQAKAFRALMDLNGWSGNQLSKELGISQSGVVQALALLDLPAPVLLAVDKGELAASSAYAIATLSDPATQAEIAAQAVAGGMTRAEVVESVRQTSSRPGRASKGGVKGRGGAKPPKPRTFKVDGGRVMVEPKRATSIVAMLREALAQAEALLEARGQEAA